MLGIIYLSLLSSVQAQSLLSDTAYLQPLEVLAIRATEKTPVTKTTLTKKEIEAKNIGQDLPFILNQVPSVIINSDAGNGIGYTGIRIRGSDASRINVTLNGIPYNDAESQGTYFVDLPDIASSASSIQVQRGVGTSTNGAGAFAGSINISTNDLHLKKGFELNSSAGSYGSFKNTLLFNTGLLGKHLTFDGRVSNIRSDGYIDRASSRLRSYYGSMAWLNSNSSLRFNVLSGKEKTYQAWYGIDEETLKTNRRYNSAGTQRPGSPYDNETDNYLQTHYQLFYNHRFSTLWKANAAAFLTRGKGYYEQYKAGAPLSSYGLPDYISGNDTTTTTDLVRRLWLDNYFYGMIFSGQFESSKRQVVIGGGVNEYDGSHYGKIIRAVIQPAVPSNYRYYDLDAKKTDASVYTKWTEKLNPNWQTFIDLQVRAVNYHINGFENNPSLFTKKNYLFFNPKAGITHTSGKMQSYFSFAQATKEPNRDDFEAGKTTQPKAETLNDFEAGVDLKAKTSSFGISLFYMNYKNQLVLTGSVNDVGAYTRTNIPSSYRAGIELTASATVNNWFRVNGNLTLSRNRVKNFTEYLDDYDNGGQITKSYKKGDLAFSPDIISSAELALTPVENAEINFVSKYVSRQYLDNTSQVSRSLHGYFTEDVRASYHFKQGDIQNVKLFVQVNNLFSKKYEPNGYTFSYISGGSIVTENFYYPMAPVNFMAGINIRL